MVFPCPAPCLSNDVQNGSGYLLPPESGLIVCEAGAAYCPRSPMQSVLYGVVSGHLETFLPERLP